MDTLALLDTKYVPLFSYSSLSPLYAAPLISLDCTTPLRRVYLRLGELLLIMSSPSCLRHSSRRFQAGKRSTRRQNISSRSNSSDNTFQRLESGCMTAFWGRISEGRRCSVNGIAGVLFFSSHFLAITLRIGKSMDDGPALRYYGDDDGWVRVLRG